ncbi:MAG: tetratricopeptide repeat protein, partial [Bacteroidota bacterium]|nr:tetratricopeptide repeat protein [Bacteroidota bacterium]
WNNLGTARFQLEDYTGAIDAYNEAIKIKPEYGFAYSNRGSAKELTKDFKGACKDWKKAVELGIKEAENYLQDCQ